MTTPTYTSPFTGTVVTPTDVSYYSLFFSANTQLYWPSVVNGEQVVAARIIDCVASTAGLIIFLPDATQGALGTDILFRNLGLYDIVIEDANGSGSFTVGVGQARYVYLTDNTSIAGVWGNIEFGVGTSFADAAQLQGAGLTTITGKLATTQNLVNVTSTPVSTITDASRASTFVWGGGAGTFNLPALSSLSNGWYIGFRNNGTGALTLAPVAPTQINNQSTIVANPGDSGYIIYDSNSSEFITVGLSAPANITFTSATYDVDSIVGNTFSLVTFAPIIQKYIAQTGTRTQTLTVTLPATTQLYILINDTNESGYNVQFVVSGSLSPPLVVTTGNIATVLCDGQNLFLLTQTSSSQFYAVDGVEAAPSYSFLSDTSTGMYLPGTGILGLSANAVEIVNIDNSNVLQPQVTVSAELTANLISGGTF
jgi:hypothetical protein